MSNQAVNSEYEPVGSLAGYAALGVIFLFFFGLWHYLERLEQPIDQFKALRLSSKDACYAEYLLRHIGRTQSPPTHRESNSFVKECEQDRIKAKREDSLAKQANEIKSALERVPAKKLD